MAEKVEGEFGLREEFFPLIVWEGWGYAGEDTEEVRLEGAYGAFGYVAAMNIGGY